MALVVKKGAEPAGAQALLRAIEILERLEDRDSPQSLSEVARRVQITLPTAHRLLRALEYKGFVVFDADVRRYSLGPTIMRLAGTIMRHEDPVQVAMPSLERLLALTHETVALHRPLGGVRVCITELEAPHPIRMASGVGRSYPLHAGAAGKALLAWASQDRVGTATATPRRITSRTPTSREALFADLASIRRQGYALSFGETVEGASAIAAPILDSSGRAVAAINITGPIDRWTRARMLRAVEPLLRETRLVMRRLGHEPPAANRARLHAVGRGIRAARS